MLTRLLLLFAGLFSFSLSAQSPSNKYALDALPVGGKEAVEQVLQTQLSLPKTLLAGRFEADIHAYFDLDSSGRAIHVKLEGTSNNSLRKEITRLLNFITFLHTQNTYGDPYVLDLNISAEKYNHYFKQKYRLNFKKPLAADSSFIIYTRADKAPEYYKNGEEGIKELILNGMEYPKLAIEKSVEGTVVIDFIVETNGYITDLKVKKGLGAGCTDEALRMILQTRWQPAVLNNSYVRYRTSYPITFSLRNTSKDNASSSQTLGQ